MLRRMPAVLMFLATAPIAAAHDFWLEPSSFRPPLGQKLELELIVGERFSGDRVLRDGTRILSFVATGATAEKGAQEKILGFDGKTPAGIFRPKAPGLLLVGYQSNGTAIEIEAPKFESYLREEGLDGAAAERQRRGENASKGREVYARWAGWDRVLGFPIEIVPEQNPCTLPKDAELPVRVLFQGKPLANALVGCMPKQDPTQEVRLRTDAEGRVRFAPKLGGAHLLRAVHMVRAPERADHDWESQWASLTFEAPAR